MQRAMGEKKVVERKGKKEKEERKQVYIVADIHEKSLSYYYQETLGLNF